MRREILHLTMVALAAFLGSCAPVTMPAPSSQGPAARHPSSRPEAPKLRKLSNGHYRVKRPWHVRLNGRSYHIQKGYTSNGITAPDSIKSRLGDGVDHPETWAAMFHDWLFTQPGMSRQKADQLFYDLLLAYGVTQTKARLMYTTVSAYSSRKQGN